MNVFDVELSLELSSHLLRVLKGDEQTAGLQGGFDLVHQSIAKLLREVKKRKTAQNAIQLSDSFALQSRIEMASVGVAGKIGITADQIIVQLRILFEQYHFRPFRLSLIDIFGNGARARSELGDGFHPVPWNGLDHFFGQKGGAWRYAADLFGRERKFIQEQQLFANGIHHGGRKLLFIIANALIVAGKCSDRANEFLKGF
jgi:hypothetical protein